MNTDFRLSAGYFEHPKIQKVSRKLGDSGVLSHIRLLRFVAVNRPDGDLSGMDTLEVALAGGYAGDEEAFVSCLLDARLLDRGENGEMRVHDWVDHNEYAATAPQRKAKASTAANARWGNTDTPAPPGVRKRTPPAPKPDDAPAADAPQASSNREPSNADSGPLDYPADAKSCYEQDLAMLNPDLALPDTQSSNAPTSKPSYKQASLPTSEANPTTTTSLQAPEPPVAEPNASDCCPPGDGHAVVVASLRELGVSESVAPMLVQRRGPDACRKQIEWLPARIKDREGTPKAVRDPVSLLVNAIEDGYAVPASYSQARQREAEEARRTEDAGKRHREAAQQAEEARQIKEAGKVRLAEAWEALPPKAREKIIQEASSLFVSQLPTNKAKLAKHDNDPQSLPLASRLEWERIRDTLLLQAH